MIYLDTSVVLAELLVEQVPTAKDGEADAFETNLLGSPDRCRESRVVSELNRCAVRPQPVVGVLESARLAEAGPEEVFAGQVVPIEQREIDIEGRGRLFLMNLQSNTPDDGVGTRRGSKNLPEPQQVRLLGRFHFGPQPVPAPVELEAGFESSAHE